ncbi:MATE family efflux transporter [Fusibacter sp. 3D3]|uniref:MATE family efflux transporter n=1 Tax=Fusibacter sp. 3D3 TaxID=1048380 RepID=UPI001586148F|nr:MATE family efflux transporter [Fusibacter sp. 3D3]
MRKSIRVDIAKMILPIMMANILEMLVGLVSMALIGNLGFIAIGAMGLSTRVRGIVWAIYKGIAIGAQVVIAQALGRKDHVRIREASRQTLVSIFIVSIAFSISMWAFPESWLQIFGAKDALLKVGSEILKIVACGLPFLGLVIVISGAMQGKGDAITPLIISGVMNVLNLVFGIILVNGLLGMPRLGLKGAAYAMVLGQFWAAVLGIVLALKKSGILYGLNYKNIFKFSKDILKSVYRTGIPSALESLFWQMSSILLIRAILTYGDDVYAAYQLGLQAESIAYMPAAGFGIAATAYVGRFIGAEDMDSARNYFREITWGVLLISILGGGILILLPSALLGVMTSDANLIQIAIIYMIICGFAQIPQNLAGVMGGALRGAGYTKIPMYTAAIGLYGVRVPMALLSAYVFDFSVNMVFLAIGLDMAIRLILSSFFYYKIDIYNNPKHV